MVVNPFRPGFGVQPNVVVGRDELLAPFEQLFAEFDPGHAHRMVLFEAHRGAGKTVVLDEVQELATANGWWVLQEDAGAARTPLLVRLIDRLLERCDELEPPAKRRLSGGTVAGVSVSTEAVPAPVRVTSVRSVLERVVGLERNGVLVSIDEIHDASDDELAEFGNAVQHLHRQQLPVVVALAGLPGGARRSSEPTFLARCRRPPVGATTDAEIERGFVETAALVATSFEMRALQHAVTAAAGFPYMMQLVGYHTWENASDRALLTVADVDAAIPAAMSELARAVTLKVDERLSSMEREFLVAMTYDASVSRMRDIRERLGKSAQYVNVYRSRLIDTGVIRSAGHGLVSFAVPGLRELLGQSHAHHIATTSRRRLNDRR